MKDLIIVGAGGLGRAVSQIVLDVNSNEKKWNLIGFLDDNVSIQGTEINALGVLGGTNCFLQYPNVSVVIAIANTSVRKNVACKAKDMGIESYATLVHPSAWLARGVQLGVGSVIYPGVIVDPDVVIGDHVIINKACTLGHDCQIEDYVTISPGVNIGGKVSLGTGCFLGINSCIVEGRSVGRESIVGAGSVVIRDVEEGVTVVGVPGRVIERNAKG